MNYLKTHRNVVLAIVVVLALVFFAGFYYFKLMGPRVPPIRVEKREIDATKLPESFPKDIPIEQGATVTQNYNAISAGGRFQATRVFETTKSLDANIKIYQDYFKANKWTINAFVDQENYKMILATKDNFQIQVSINHNIISGINTVDISFTKSPIIQKPSVKK